jgi:D-tyrosyl-tRNA(Tyr) deacylase
VFLLTSLGNGESYIVHLHIHLECFDNSNIQGSNAVAACVVFKMGKPSKQDYRKFNIKTVEGPDDYASMKEVVRRRYTRLIEEGSPLPDLIITDGGKGQMEVVREVIEDELHLRIPIAGLAKDRRHRTSELLYGFPPLTIGLRVFDDENGVMNKSILEAEGNILVISQFTLFASYKKGNRPSYIRAARPETAIPLYEYFCNELSIALGRDGK